MLAVVLVITVFFVWAFGHPVAWSIVGSLFGAAPLAALLLALGVAARGAIAAGPGWVGVRVVTRWRVIDLGQVRVVRLGGNQAGGSGSGSTGRFGGPDGFGGPNHFGGTGNFGDLGGLGGLLMRVGLVGPGRLGPEGDGAGPAGSIVLEDSSGRRVDIGVDALEGGLADVVRSGLPPDAVVDPGAARALGAAPTSEEGDDGT